MDNDAFVIGGVRTAVAKYGGALSHIRLDDLLGQTMAAACSRVEVPLERVEEIVAGCVNPAHEGMGNLGRWAALAAGFPDSVPAITVNRYCASSLSAAVTISHAIRSGEMDIGLAAGAESMSRSGWAFMKEMPPSLHGDRKSCWTPCGQGPADHHIQVWRPETPTSR